MAPERILILGGAGFIGNHLTRALAQEDYEVCVLDSLERQVHGEVRGRPDSLAKGVRFVRSRVSNLKTLKTLIKEVDAVVNLAAVVGVGQSMYAIRDYVDKNTGDTAALLDALVNHENQVSKLIVASSMSVYGEGQYYCSICKKPTFPCLRNEKRLSQREWDHLCDICGTSLKPVPTVEDKPLTPSSVYALSKRDQEEMSLLIGRTYSIPTVALRFFNVYGPGQSLSNPYTGVCSILMSRIMSGEPPYIFEDGNQIRDLIHISDIVSSITLAIKTHLDEPVPINIGTGKAISILELARHLLQLYGSRLQPRISGDFRRGDIRHCYADISRAKKLLGFEPKVSLKDGLAEFVRISRSRSADSIGRFDESLRELESKQLIGFQEHFPSQR